MYVCEPVTKTCFRYASSVMLRNVCTDLESPYSKESLPICVQGWLGVVYLFPLVSGTGLRRQSWRMTR